MSSNSLLLSVSLLLGLAFIPSSADAGLRGKATSLKSVADVKLKLRAKNLQRRMQNHETVARRRFAKSLGKDNFRGIRPNYQVDPVLRTPYVASRELGIAGAVLGRLGIDWGTLRVSKTDGRTANYLFASIEAGRWGLLSPHFRSTKYGAMDWDWSIKKGTGAVRQFGSKHNGFGKFVSLRWKGNRTSFQMMLAGFEHKGNREFTEAGGITIPSAGIGGGHGPVASRGLGIRIPNWLRLSLSPIDVKLSEKGRSLADKAVANLASGNIARARKNLKKAETIAKRIALMESRRK